MIYIYDREFNQIDHIDVEPIITEEIGKLRTLEFECDKEIEKGFRVVAEIEDKPYEFIIIDSEYSRDNIVDYSYFCQDALVELQSQVILDKRPNGDVKIALNSILENTGWVNEVRSTTNSKTNSFYRVSVLEAFSDVMESYRTEWQTEYKWIGSKITERRIVVYVRDGVSKGRLEFGKNIVNFKRNILSEPIITAIYPYGKGEELENGAYGRRISIEDVNNGQAYIENVEATQIYGYGSIGNKKPLFGFLILEDVEDKNELLNLAQEELDIVSQVRAEYEVEAIDFDIEAKIGYEVPIIDDEIGFRANARIIKIVRHGEDITLTFGTVTKKFVDKFESSIKRTEKGLEDVYVQLNTMRTSADGKTNVFTGPTEPTQANEGDLWYKENADGTVDMLIFKDGQFIEGISSRVFEELKQQLEENATAISQAQTQAQQALERADKIDQDIQNIGDLSTALEQLNDAQTSINNLEVQISEAIGNISADFYDHAPTPPYNLHQKWYKTHYTPSLEIDQGYDVIRAEDNVTLDEFANPGLFICINPRTEGETFHWNDWKRIATDNTDLINYSIDNLRSEVDKQAINSLNSIKLINDDLVKANEKLSLYYSELLKKADSSEFKILTDTVKEQGLTIGNIKDNQGILIGSVNDIKNTADKSEQTLINLIGTNPDGTYKVAEYNQKISTAQGDIQKIYKDLDPTNTLGTAYKLNETKKSVDSISTSLINYAKKTDLNGLATESYVTTNITTEAGKIRSEFEDVARKTDLTGLVSETKMTSAIEVSTNQIKTELGKYATKTDISGLATETYVTNETTKTANAINETLKSYAKTTQLTGLATESYAQTIATQEAGKVQSLLVNYAKTTDLNGLATETYALTVATQEAGKVQTLLQGYAKTEDLNGYTTTEQLNSSISTVNSKISSLSTKVDGEITKINTLTSTVDGNSTVIADLLGETGNKSLSTIRNLIDEHSTTLMSLPDNVTGFVTTDDKNLPIPPYKKGWLWNKEAYDFTQGWDVIKSTDTITLAEFAEAGQWIVINERTSGTFDWNDFKRVSADQQGQISQVYQDLNTWAVTLKNYQTDTTTKLGVIEGSISQTVRKGELLGQINTEAGNVLIRAKDGTNESMLNITPDGAFMDEAFIQSAHIADGVINTAHIGDLTFDWAVGKTLNAELVNVINLNANNITGNKTQFVQSVWNSLSSSVSIESLGMRLRNQSLNWSAYLGASGMEFKDDLTSTPVGVLRATIGTDGHANGVNLVAEKGFLAGLGYRNAEGQLRSMVYVENDVNGNAKLKLNNDLFSLGDRFKFVFDSVDDNMALIVGRGTIANQPSVLIRNPKAPNGVGGTLYIGDDGIVRVLNADGNGYKTLN